MSERSPLSKDGYSGSCERRIRRTKQDTLELLRILRDGVPERKSRTGSKASPRSLKHGLKALQAKVGR
jgi:hypothetical protein